ncbi:MAG: DNA gyrase subunit A [Planctomycetes bacterium]|nr:DNA gyrase subunit A [Planctomycetota bacterium]MCC7397499.1 DNA gyrase subunit A [Planctomycetota bacterium]
MTDPTPPTGGRITDLLLEREMRESYLNYSMSVILSRALPDARDGLKPSQRRVLVAMNDLNLGPRSKHRKCAKICGDTSGNYHPHGESVVYPTLVGMAQPFTTRYPLVDSQGNFGAIDGSPPAAMRYTEARMGYPATHLLEDLDKETVDMVPNYDGQLMQPVVLPARFPNLVCNGSTGIAVGMAASLAPHNLREVAKALEKLYDNPEVTLDELLEVVQGPDFPTGGTVMGRSGIRNAYASGRGQVSVRAKYHVEEKKGRKQLVFTEVPFQVKTTTILERIDHLVKSDQIDSISDANDESNDRVGLRLVVELKKGVEDETVTVNQLFKLSPLQSTFSIINLAIVDGRPRTLSFKQMLECHRDHRIDVIRRRTRFLLRKAEERLHILDGLRLAVQNIDEVVEIIRRSANVDDARQRLIARFKLSDVQARAILSMRLSQLTGLEIDKLEAEHKEVTDKIAYYRTILADRAVLFGLMKQDLKEMVEQYGDARRTVISDEEVGNFVAEDLIPVEMMCVTVTHHGYIKRTALDQYRTQGRGGKGVSGAETKEGDFLWNLFVASTHDYLLFFTDRGRCYWKKVYELPSLGRTAKGRSLANVVEAQEGEKITAILRVDSFDDRFLVTATRNGLIKKTALEAYSRPRAGGIIAVGLEDGDSLVGVNLCRPGQTIVLGTRDGISIRFEEADARAMGRSAVGVWGIRLEPGDAVCDMLVTDGTGTLLTVCENGYGKRTPVEEYRLQSRGGKGIIDIKTSDRNGKVVNVLAVGDDDEVMMITKDGQIVRTKVSEISVIGRNTQGVRCISLNEGDRLVSVARIPQEEPEQPEQPEQPTAGKE